MWLGVMSLYWTIPNVGNSLIRSSIFCSKSLILKIDCKRIALFALWKRAMWGIRSWANCSKNSYFSYVFDSVPLLMFKSKSLLSLFTYSLFFKEQLKQFALFHERIALSLTKNERIAWKTDERFPEKGPLDQRNWHRFLHLRTMRPKDQ